MKRAIALAIVLMSINPSGFADSGNSSPSDESKPLELPDFSTVRTQPQDSKGQGKPIISCTTRDGHQIKNGEPGYAACIESLQLQQSTKARGQQPESTGSSGESLNINWKFGK